MQMAVTNHIKSPQAWGLVGTCYLHIHLLSCSSVCLETPFTSCGYSWNHSTSWISLGWFSCRKCKAVGAVSQPCSYWTPSGICIEVSPLWESSRETGNLILRKGCLKVPDTRDSYGLTYAPSGKVTLYLKRELQIWTMRRTWKRELYFILFYKTEMTPTSYMLQLSYMLSLSIGKLIFISNRSRTWSCF